MSLKLSEPGADGVLEVDVTGKLTHADYDRFAPEFERLLKVHRKLRILFHMKDFHGWEAVALWDDIKFDAKHFADIERLAIVGEKTWQKWMGGFCKPFTTAKIEVFDNVEDARAWLVAKEPA